MTERQLIVVDIETKHTVVEVAWENLNTGSKGCFVPSHDVPTVLAEAEIQALQTNRYIDRLAKAEQDTDRFALNDLMVELEGNTFAGCNPTFDASFLHPLSGWAKPKWHYRLLDLSAYAAGVLGFHGSVLPGLKDVCRHLDVELVDAHTAAGDVAATAECFRRLFARNGASAA